MTFGLLLVLVLALLTAGGWVLAAAIDRRALAPEQRRRIGIVLVCLVALVPVGAVVGAAASTRGFTGEVSHVWSTLTNTNSGVGNSAGRLVQLGNSRPTVLERGPPGRRARPARRGRRRGFGVARTRYTTDSQIVEHAHSYPVETFADFGLIGLARQPRPARRLGPRRVAHAAWPGDRPVTCGGGRAGRRADLARRRRRLRRPLRRRLDVVHSGHGGARAALRGLARRARTARRAGRARERPALAAHPPAGCGRPRRAARPRRDRGVAHLAAAAVGRCRCRGDHRALERQRRRRARRRPHRGRQRSAVAASRCGSCRRSTARSASRRRPAPSCARRSTCSRRIPRRGAELGFYDLAARPQPRRARRSQPVAAISTPHPRPR